LFWFVGLLGLPSGHSWPPVVGSSLACILGLPKNTTGWCHQIRIDGKQYMYTNKLNQIDIKTYAGVWMWIPQHITHFGPWMLAGLLSGCVLVFIGVVQPLGVFWDRLTEWGGKP